MDLLTVMAYVAAIRIEHARLAEVEQQERLMALELTQASEIQQSLLPSEAPEVAGYYLGGYNLPYRTVGGDYFDFTRHPDGRLGLVVGDVSGKGLPAALMISSLQARVQILAATELDPAAAITILNRNLAQRFPTGKLITFSILPSVHYQLQESQLEPGDTLALYSDGVTEARSCEDEEFGESGLANFLVQSRSASCARKRFKP